MRVHNAISPKEKKSPNLQCLDMQLADITGTTGWDEIGIEALKALVAPQRVFTRNYGTGTMKKGSVTRSSSVPLNKRPIPIGSCDRTYLNGHRSGDKFDQRTRKIAFC